MNTLKVGDQVTIVDGAFMGHTAIVREFDGAWVYVTLRDGGMLWLAASLVRLCEE